MSVGDASLFSKEFKCKTNKVGTGCLINKQIRIPLCFSSAGNKTDGSASARPQRRHYFKI